ncbi:carbohydrate esterase family 4 protein [Aaosphaeria arxii CBS 175.79]|uniref:Carbohydrate esterase family 4 protein n=1 Tax=Aaosphaeria arxii CBS 175.79 TaxID=1450172 RepID=A0A6A5XNW5_9PLEO|nr:carbohydrate esterase family 4 protein [Aaosphaeria arxii CBS 175.79]KAF2014832.1 carbohydrate esterase family 4 protein [Aaosphaeria arxii CBS 175.79]
MLFTHLIGLAAGLAGGVSAACSSALKIDDFSKWSSNTNSLNSWTSDDGSMTSSSASGGVLSFRPKSGSYFYETFACQAATSNGYNSVQFTIKGPASGSLTLEIQTKSSCSASSYTSYYYSVTGLLGNTQTVTIPLSSFNGANGNAVTAFVWSGFSSTTTTWQISNVQFGCGGSSGISSTQRPSSTLVTAVSSVRSTLVTSALPSGTCAPLAIDDWASQSRLTFLFYNSLMMPTSDDGTFKSLEVNKPAKNRVTLTPKDKNSYFYTQLGCTNAKDRYGGISLRIKAPAGTTLSVQLESSASCDPASTIVGGQTSTQLGWSFDGTEKVYTIPFSKFPSVDTSKLVTLFFSQFSQAVSFGPVAFYCGNSGAEYIVSTTTPPAGPSSTVAAPSGTAAALVIDRFATASQNALGFWHGGDEGMTLNYNGGKLTITSADADYSFYTQVSGSCSDFSKYKGSYLHIAYSGSTSFTVALQQHNSQCNANIAPFPETWDSAEASRYAKDGHIYIPMSHFNVNLQRTIGLAIKGFYSASSVTLSVIEIVPSVPRGWTVPNKLETGDLVFACKRPNSFAFAIDDGSPEYAQEVMNIIKSEGIKVTFFTVGAPLLDASTNLTNVYREMESQGHQIALHSFTHPKMEGLPDYASIDWEYNEDIKAVKKQLNNLHSPYFRPPFGNEGARMRSRLAQSLGEKPTITMWSVDVEDWLWAETDTPEEQLKAFQRDVDKGGNLVVLHYLYPSTVSYLRQFIQIAKATGKQLMRVDQCMNDPNAPPL